MGDGDLQKRIEQLGQTLVAEIESWEKKTRDQRRRTLEQLTETVGRKIERALDHQQARETRRERRSRIREERRERQREHASALGGVVQLVVGATCLAFAALRPELWWLIFVALGFSMGGARQLKLAGDRRREEKRALVAAAPEPAPEPPAHEVDALCDGLLADLKSSPEAVRSFLQKPEQTVQSLRQTARALDARRQQLLRDADDEHLGALGAQRAALVKKRDAAHDAQARAKLDDAVRSLDGQLAALGQLRASAERVDGEYTSLLVLLQELRTRVAVARTAGSAPQLDGLKQSVAKLNLELEAITEALEAVQHEGLPGVSAISSDDAVPPAPGERDRV